MIAVSLSIGSNELVPQVDNILKVCKRADVECIVVLAGHSKLDPIGCNLALKTVEYFPDGSVRCAFADGGTFSASYLEGMSLSATLADFVISMDADGSHDPEEIPNFVEAFERGSKVVLASRFMSGAVYGYSLQRRLVSFLGTLLGNTFLSINGKKLTDFTSGFEGVSSDVVKKVFEKYPPDKWLSATSGPYHLQNTILRMVLIILGYEISEIPIRYGVQKKGRNFKIAYLLKAFKGFISLVREKNALLAEK